MDAHLDGDADRDTQGMDGRALSIAVQIGRAVADSNAIRLRVSEANKIQQDLAGLLDCFREALEDICQDDLAASLTLQRAPRLRRLSPSASSPRSARSFSSS